MPQLTLVQAINSALARAMAEDPRVFVLGEDVGVDGGVFRATDGLLDRFGPERVIDTPLAEAAITGLSIGLAQRKGFRPVAEIQFTGFIYPTIDQLANHAAATAHPDSRSVELPDGAALDMRRWYPGAGAPFGEPEAMFAHIPGLRVVLPSSPRRAYGLLLAAIRDPDPVVFLEPTRLYRASREEIADDGVAAPLDRCFVLREGTDITLVAWGGMIPEVLAAVDALAGRNISAEVIDVATLKPLDTATILASVEKTGRCIIVHEAPLTAGFGGEIAARVAEQALSSLVAPIIRVAGFDTVLPLPRLEGFYLPNAERIFAAADRAMAFA